ncbi:MAG: hypothetical protein JSW27_17580 [Phycisphaerales bacterium]|nr:MAG: hypothetical protein JSW27_17580 [Phycisphaerales bacterium]
MSRKLLCLMSFLLVLALAGNGMAQIDPATVTDGHVYRAGGAGGGIVPDSSAVGHTANIIGDPQVVDILGGRALQFDGVDDGVHSPDSRHINVTNGPWHSRTIIAVFNCADANKPDPQVVYQEGGGTRGFNIYVQAGEVIVGGWNKADYTPQWSPGSWISAPIASNEWHAVACVLRDGAAGQEDDKFEMWMDGVLIAKAPGAEMRNHGNDNSIGYSKQTTVLPSGNLAGDAGYFEGLISEVWILNQGDQALTEAELAPLMVGPQPVGDPLYLKPVDGTQIEETSVMLEWRLGELATSHNVYVGTDADAVAAGTVPAVTSTLGLVTAGIAGGPIPDGLLPDTTYYWRVESVNDVNPDSPWSSAVMSISLPPRRAYDPSPIDGNKILDLSANLTWIGGWNPIMYNVHFGTVPAAMLPVSIMQMDATYDTGALEPDTTYYWRVDEFFGFETVTGLVWSFRTVPDIPLSDDPNLVGQWTFDGDSGGVVLDQSGHGGHAVLVGDVQIVAGIEGEGLQFDGSNGEYAEAPNHVGVTGTGARTVSAWIKTAALGEIASWGQNVAGQKWIFRVQGDNGVTGAIRVEVNGGYQVGTIDVRDDEWHHVAAVLADDGSPNVTEIGLYVDGFLENNSASLDEPIDTADGVVRIGQAPWGSRPFNGLIDDVRIYDKAFSEDEMRQVFGDVAIAWQPQPALGDTVDVAGVALSWAAGDGAAEHDVYLGTDAAAVAAADASVSLGRQADTSLAIAAVLEFDSTYYWRVDEVAADGTVSAGKVWHFNTAADLTIYDEVTPFDYDTSADPFASEVSLDLDPALNLTDPIARVAVNYTGNPAPGSVSADEAAGTTMIVGRGADIWGSSDEFQYAYTTITGNGSMTVKVDSLDHTDNWTKAGIMIRETLDAGSSFAAVYATGTNGVRFQARAMANQDATSDTSVVTAEQTALTAPVWIKIERMFPMVNAYYSTDGVTFVPMSWNPQVIPMSPAPIQIGLAVTSHSGAETYATAVFSELSSDGGVTPGPLTSVEIGLTGNAAAPMSLILEDASGVSAAVTNPDAAATQQTSATDFVVNLADYAIDLTAVAKATLVIGDGTPGGSGSITINNVRLLGFEPPLAHWALDGNADDGAALGADGTVVGDPVWVAGAIGEALELDGVDDYVDCGNPAALDFGTGDFTISAWIKLTTTERATVYAKGGDNSGGIRYTLAMGEANDNKMTLTTDDDSSKRQARGDTVVNDGEWHHVVGMRSGNMSHVYVDGVLDGSIDLPEGYDLSGTSQANALLGAITDAQDPTGATLEKFFTGILDDVRVYDRAISDAEVAKLAGL